jgi:hypothetical protein
VRIDAIHGAYRMRCIDVTPLLAVVEVTSTYTLENKTM